MKIVNPFYNFLFILLCSEDKFAKLRRFISLITVICCVYATFYDKIQVVINQSTPYIDKRCYTVSKNCTEKDLTNFNEASGTIIREIMALLPVGIAIVNASPAYFSQYAIFLSANYVLTNFLKITIAWERPDKSNRKSFPSGHAVSVFSAAAFITLKHGFLLAIPTYIIGVAVCLTRFYSSKHSVVDLIGGALLPFMSIFVLYGLIALAEKKRGK